MPRWLERKRLGPPAAVRRLGIAAALVAILLALASAGAQSPAPVESQEGSEPASPPAREAEAPDADADPPAEDGAQPPEPPAPRDAGGHEGGAAASRPDDTFAPSERVGAGSSVSFPVDI